MSRSPLFVFTSCLIGEWSMTHAASFSTASKIQNKISEAVKTDRELEHYYQVIVNSTDPAKTKYQNAFLTDKDRKEHQILKVFHDTDADPMGLSDHIREEESVDLVKIEHLLDLTESDRMAARRRCSSRHDPIPVHQQTAL
ncbi:HHE domain-containing protein [Microsporum canis CBS 113480]|uniref:HHE domain-containing protein n=1 Tax=Arthroderma otae (strain ATCC MYA-4605 / CBS 113480) TaxID=554155 RepID=C5FZF3_ARTOC|nr:HHE domain-containing protein [Microsporum canis CBS 113480]EEQ35256.1 HHE domain-containing protein [Microsporum canis CBS 113480]